MQPWETCEGKQVWKTESQYFTWLRGAIRRIWSDYPVRKVWKNEQLRGITQEEKDSKKYHFATKKVGQCAFCLKWMSGSKLQCDHKHASNGYKTIEESMQFLIHCAYTLPSDWQLACKSCHDIKSYSDRHNITFEEASIEKQIISMMKNKKAVNEILSKNHLPGHNDKVRKEGLRTILKQKEKVNSNAK